MKQQAKVNVTFLAKKQANMLRAIQTLVLICQLFVEGDFRIIDKPIDTEVKIGESTYLNCTSSDPSGISWFHSPVGRRGEHDYVYTNGQLLKPYEKRFRVERYESRGSYHFNLILRIAVHSDAGQYFCQSEGKDSAYSAELIVIEADPSCVWNIDFTGLIGPNSCGLPRDALHLSCGISYEGNTLPSVQWARIAPENPFKVSEFALPSSCKADKGQVVCNYTADSEIEMDGSRFVCRNKRSKTDGHICRSDVLRIHYALGETMPRQAVVGDVVTCSPKASSSSLTCSYRWISSAGKSEEVVSQNEVLTVTRTGWHQCQANCYFNNQRQCNFDVITVRVSKPSETSRSLFDHQVIHTVLMTLGACVVIFLIIGFCASCFGTKFNGRGRQIATNCENGEKPTESRTNIIKYLTAKMRKFLSNIKQNYFSI